MTEQQNSEDILSTIASLAPVVAQQHVELSAAYSEETQAAAEVLARAIELARPALKALASRIKCAWGATAGRNGCNPVEEADYLDVRGLCLTDSKPGPVRERSADGNRGNYGSSDLFLMTDGSLLEARYEGTWSLWQGEWDRWSMATTPRTVLEVARNYKLDELLGRLAEALTQQAEGKGPERAKAARERAAKLSALVELSK